MRNEKLLDVCCTLSIVMVISGSRGRRDMWHKTGEYWNTSVGETKERNKATELSTDRQRSIKLLFEYIMLINV